jgi:hypothetical protein
MAPARQGAKFEAGAGGAVFRYLHPKNLATGLQPQNFAIGGGVHA